MRCVVVDLLVGIEDLLVAVDLLVVVDPFLVVLVDLLELLGIADLRVVTLLELPIRELFAAAALRLALLDLLYLLYATFLLLYR